jgi:hypothetical protein
VLLVVFFLLSLANVGAQPKTPAAKVPVNPAKPVKPAKPIKIDAQHLAFVLLPEGRAPKGEAIEAAFSSYAPKEQRLRWQKADTQKPGEAESLSFELSAGGTAFVAYLPRPVPRHEADDAARFSVSSLGTKWTLPAHKAHLLVTLGETGAASPQESLSRFTSLLAAVIDASHAVGVYWGKAGATHDAKFFLETARSADEASRLMLWTGVRRADEPDGRISLLSLGMQQLQLPDLLLVAPKSEANDALATFFDLLSYVAERGTALPEGHTVGRSETHRLPVHYVPSPLDAKTKVWRVELK